tara:strand:- start:5387 stop:7270 length:1884 start_codon:yes stop_codon:yes gene_type:complete
MITRIKKSLRFNTLTFPVIFEELVMDNTLENITWDNSKAYKGFDDPKMSSDLEMAEKVIPEIEKEAEPFEELLEKSDADLNSYLESSRNLLRKKMDLSVDLQMLSSYSYFKLSTEADHKDAKEVSSRAQKLSSDLKKAIAPLEIFLVKSADSFFNDFIKDERVQESKFLFESLRKRIDFLLTTKEEVALTGLSVDGLHAWGKLYRDIAGNMEIDIDGEKMGLAQASSLLRGPNRESRKKAWLAINKSWEGYKESTSAILNAINGWRIESNKMRSTKRPLHYLDQSCHESRITNKTLNALMDSAYENRSVGQKALKVMAKIMDVSKLGPWDLLSPCPINIEKEEKIPFPEAINIIKKSFSKFNPEMGEFVEMMADKKWIDSLPTPKRNPGAYCSRFSKLREPRVFMTYTGSMGNVLTLAHELGHAYHNWVMRDLPLGETSYPMTLAETASIFAETLVRDSILSECSDDQDKLKILWQNALSGATLLINIPARFEFEKNLVEERFKRNLTPDQLKTMMTSAWKKWYGDTLSEYDSMFWSSKLHFSISGLGFYNYPYLFGYLFSLGLYSLKDSENFANTYNKVLRDTGKMTAEELVSKYLGKNIEENTFWDNGINLVNNSINSLEDLLKK